MRILLPPSEGKASGGRGTPIADRAPTGPLTEARARVLHALAELLDSGDTRAAEALLLPPRVAADALALNRAVLHSATMPALRRYTGVVYEGLRYRSLPRPAQRVAARSVIVFSGLWGVLRGDEPVPAYRVPAKATLPGLGSAAAFWRPVLGDVLPPLLAGKFVVDLRSSDYAAMWRPRPGIDAEVLAVRVLSPLPSRRLGVVSYRSKLGKGRLAAALVRRAADGLPCASTADVAEAWTACGGHDAQPRGGGLDLVDQ